MTNTPSEEKYNSNYLAWKAWGASDFGNLSFKDKSYFTAELKRLPLDFNRPLDAMEIGFGNGQFLRYGTERGWNIVGTEANPYLTQAAKEMGFKALNTENLSEFTDNQFDLVAAFDVLEHIPQDVLLGFLKEVVRILKPGGIFLGRSPNGDSPFGLSDQHGDITHVTILGSGKVHYFAKQLDVELLYCQGQSETLLRQNPLSTLRRLVSLCFRKLINGFVFFVFYPKRDFCSENLVFAFQKRSQKPI
jgi:SAM-dependent methyltransferase